MEAIGYAPEMIAAGALHAFIPLSHQEHELSDSGAVDPGHPGYPAVGACVASVLRRSRAKAQAEADAHTKNRARSPTLTTLAASEGLLRLALSEQAGFSTVAFCEIEIDPFCQRVLRQTLARRPLLPGRANSHRRTTPEQMRIDRFRRLRRISLPRCLQRRPKGWPRRLEIRSMVGISVISSLANFDLASRSWKIPAIFAAEGSMSFSETWPRSGMMQNGIAYRLAPLTRLTRATTRI